MITDELLTYYDRELRFLREMGAQFSRRYPDIARRLSLSDDECEDPQVERLFESFAFLAARIHSKLDDDLPLSAEAILNVVFPQLLRPIPSMSVMQVELDDTRGKLTGKLLLEAGTRLYAKKPVDDIICQFHTAYDIELWPMEITAAAWTSPDLLRPQVPSADAPHAIRINFKAFPDIEFAKLGMDRIRLYLQGDDPVIFTLYETLSNRVGRILIREPGSKRPAVELSLSHLRPLGFESLSEDNVEHQSEFATEPWLLPYPGQSFTGYRLLQEFFAFHQKFFFVELSGLAGILQQGFKSDLEIIFLCKQIEGEGRLKRLERIDASTFRLGCSPVVNLFPYTCDPIHLDGRSSEYPLRLSSRPDEFELFAVREVLGHEAGRETVREYYPFYSIDRGANGTAPQAFWIANRRPSLELNDEGTDMYLSFVNTGLEPFSPSAEAVTVRTLATNRDLASALDIGNSAGDLNVDISAPIKRVVLLVPVTTSYRPPSGKVNLWRLISQLSLNYLSLVSEGKDALKEILRLNNFSDSPNGNRMIHGLKRLSSERGFARITSDEGVAFARGWHVEIELDEEQFSGGGAYLFSAVLERFLASYTSLNSYTQLTARSNRRREAIGEWKPRAGQKILV